MSTKDMNTESMSIQDQLRTATANWVRLIEREERRDALMAMISFLVIILAQAHNFS